MRPAAIKASWVGSAYSDSAAVARPSVNTTMSGTRPLSALPCVRSCAATSAAASGVVPPVGIPIRRALASSTDPVGRRTIRASVPENVISATRSRRRCASPSKPITAPVAASIRRWFDIEADASTTNTSRRPDGETRRALRKSASSTTVPDDDGAAWPRRAATWRIVAMGSIAEDSSVYAASPIVRPREFGPPSVDFPTSLVEARFRAPFSGSRRLPVVTGELMPEPFGGEEPEVSLASASDDSSEASRGFEPVPWPALF